jgi:FkbM family methyltransferase
VGGARRLMAIKTWLIDQLSPRHRTRAQYCYRAMTGRLDRELKLARRLVRPGSRVIDIGANTGIYVYAFGRHAPVEAFEPNPEPARILRALAGTLPAVHVHEVALSRGTGTTTLYVPYFRGRPHSELARVQPIEAPHATVVVDVRTLDAYAFTNVGLIKIDVEGHELEVLAGGVETIGRERPVLLIEIEQRHRPDDITAAFEAIAAHGYLGHFIDAAGHVHGIADFRYERHQAPYLERMADPRYMNNFLFIHATDTRAMALL